MLPRLPPLWRDKIEHLSTSKMELISFWQRHGSFGRLGPQFPYQQFLNEDAVDSDAFLFPQIIEGPLLIRLRASIRSLAASTNSLRYSCSSHAVN